MPSPRHPLTTPLDICIRLTLFAIVCVVGYAFLRQMWYEREATLRENAIVSDYNAGMFDKALGKIDAEFRRPPPPPMNPDRRQRLNDLAAKSCKHLGEDPEKPLKHQLDWYRRAQSYVPGIITDPAILKLLKKQKPAAGD